MNYTLEGIRESYLFVKKCLDLRELQFIMIETKQGDWDEKKSF